KRKLATVMVSVLALTACTAIVHAATKRDFKVSVAVKSRSLRAGGSTTYAVKVKRLNGFRSTVTLGIKKLPGGARATWHSNTKVRKAAACKKKCNVLDPKTSSATLTITTTPGTPVGTVNPTITAKG